MAVFALSPPCLRETSSDRLVSARRFFFGGHGQRVRRAILAGVQVLPTRGKEDQDAGQERSDCPVAARVDNSEAGPTSGAVLEAAAAATLEEEDEERVRRRRQQK